MVEETVATNKQTGRCYAQSAQKEAPIAEAVCGIVGAIGGRLGRAKSTLTHTHHPSKEEQRRPTLRFPLLLLVGVLPSVERNAIFA